MIAGSITPTSTIPFPMVSDPAPEPAASVLFPERWRTDRLSLDPEPVVGAPPTRGLVAAVVNERQELAVGDIVLIEGELLHECRMCRAFVIPAERRRRGVDAERDAPCRHVDPDLSWRAPVSGRLIAGRCAFVGEGQPVSHVQQRLVMHRFVFENAEDRFRAIEERMSRPLDVGVLEHIEHLSIDLFRKRAHVVS